MQESSLYQLSYRTVMFERRAGIEPAVTIRSKHPFEPSLWQLWGYPPHLGKTGITILFIMPRFELGALA